MAAEYVVLRAGHPTYLNLQLPREVADLIEYAPPTQERFAPPGHGIAFLARGPGVLRVVPTARVADILPLETLHRRFLAAAHLSEKLLFNLPQAVVDHLGLKVQGRTGRESPFTDDGLLWFLPAPEYYEFRARQRQGKPWKGPATGGLAHLYLARSVIPGPEELDALERRIDLEEWRPRLVALDRVGRARR